MARISRCDKLPEHERLRLVGMIGEGASWRTLAAEFDIPEATIRLWAETNGFQRSPVEAKRKLVDKLLAQPEPAQQPAHCAEPAHHTTGNPDTDAAAERDAKVARLAAGVAVQIIRRLATLAQQADTAPKDVVAVATALDKAWGTYARINKLDDAKPEVANDHTAMAEIVRRKLGI